MTSVSTGFIRYVDAEARLQNEGCNNLLPNVTLITEMIILCVTFLRHGEHLCSWSTKPCPLVSNRRTR